MPETANPVDSPFRTIRDEDSEFVARCRQGDTEAFSQLVRRHQKKMLNIAFRMIGDYDEACDAVQEAFLSAFRSIRKFQEKSLFSTWLYSIVLNHAKSRLRQRASRSRREVRSPDDPFQIENGNVWNGYQTQEESVLERIEKRELESKIQEGINSLDEEQKEVLVLRDIQGLSYEEIVLTLGLPQGTVRSRLFRARNALKESLLNKLGDLK